MNVLKTSMASLLLATATYASLSFSAPTTASPPNLTEVAFGYCVMNAGNDHTGAAVLFPDLGYYNMTNCSDMLKTAAEHGYTKIISTTASPPSLKTSAIEHFVIAADANTKSTAVVFCVPGTDYPIDGAVEYSNGEHVKGKCSSILQNLKTAGYSIVPELTISAGSIRNSYTGHVFVKK